MSLILLSVRPKKSFNASSPPSSRMLIRLPYVPNPIQARSWSTGFLAGGGGTTTSGAFAAMSKMVICTGVNIVRLVSVTFILSKIQADTVGVLSFLASLISHIL